MTRKRISSITTYTEHNKAELVKGGKDFFNLMHQLIGKAEACVHLQFYIFDDDETGREVKETLVQAVNRGIKVYMVLDGYASRGITNDFVSEIKKAGIHFRWFEPFLKARYSYFGRRLHNKLLVVDERYALVSGINISNRYNDLPGQPAWLDYAMFVEGEVSAQLFKVAVKMWKQARWSVKKESDIKLPFKPYSYPGHCLVRVRQNDWVRSRNEVTRSYLEMFKKANSHIYIMSSYFLPGNLLKRRLGRACKRGVHLKVIVTGTSDVYVSKQAERYMYRWLFRNNAEIYEYHKGILHAKMATYDGKWTTVGSYNFNFISTYASIELNVDVLDEKLAKEAEKELQTTIDKDCTRITEEHYRTEYNVFERFFQWLCYRLIRSIFYVFTFYFRRMKKPD
ncbi:MAG TPA: phosphatidylserine/phosphatidylglycerophosphate/cardiolipin synthase family protein [Chitinophagaceae bacterium]|nr:phosphatidylserine/phosphatidylglycerophosphate/cardiolipin synthase family protein [Chitinophagaceae bacterium]